MLNWIKIEIIILLILNITFIKSKSSTHQHHYELASDFSKLESREGFNLPSPNFSQSKIVNGYIAEEPNQYHHMMSIRTDLIPNFAICGGTLINPYTILTAAHCNKTIGFRGLVAYQGVFDFEDENDVNSGNKFKVIEFIQHKDYDPELYINDIAVLRLDKPAKFDHPIPLDDGTIAQDFLHKVRVIGWGLYGAGEVETSPVLRRADLQITDHKLCQLYMKMMLDIYIDPEKHICALRIGGQSDSCQGDSGGPLYAKVCGQWVLVGIVSFGYECGYATAPGIYTRVGHYLDWVKEHTFYK